MKSWHEMNDKEKSEWLASYTASGLKDEIGIRKPTAEILWDAAVIAGFLGKKTAVKVLEKALKEKVREK
jgi:hypothetical protein